MAKITKAQTGKKEPRAVRFAREKAAYEKPIKAKYESNTSPKVPIMKSAGMISSADTTGYAAGAKSFPRKTVISNHKTGKVTNVYYGEVKRGAVKKAIKRSARKAQTGDKLGKQTKRGLKVSGSWEGPGSPVTKVYADTSGYSAGKKRFPSTIYRTGKATKTSTVGRRLVKRAIKKGKTGGSFPDLNKDGKITKKDVLIGRGVLPKTAKSGTKIKKAILGIGIGRDERQARKYARKSNREMRRSERQSMRISRDNANPYQRGCKGGNCGSRNAGTRIVGFKKGGVKKAQNGIIKDTIDFNKRVRGIDNIDTSGYAAGKKHFPRTREIHKKKKGTDVFKKRKTITISPAYRKKDGSIGTGWGKPIKVSKAQRGTMTKKCAYGCK